MSVRPRKKYPCHLFRLLALSLSLSLLPRLSLGQGRTPFEAIVPVRVQPSYDPALLDWLREQYRMLYDTARTQYGEFSQIPDVITVMTVGAEAEALSALTSRPNCAALASGPAGTAVSAIRGAEMRAWRDPSPTANAVAQALRDLNQIRYYGLFYNDIQLQSESEFFGLSLSQLRAVYLIHEAMHLTGGIRFGSDHVPMFMTGFAASILFRGEELIFTNPDQMPARVDPGDIDFNFTNTVALNALLAKVCFGVSSR